MRVIILPLLLLCVGASATTSFPSGTPQDLTTSSMLKCRGGGLFPGGDASNSKGGVSKGKANNKKTSPNNKRVTSKGAKGQVGRARVGVSSENRGLWMNMDLDVRRLTDSMGEMGKPIAALVSRVDAAVWYGAPVLLAASLVRQVRASNRSRQRPALPFQVGVPQQTPAARALAFAPGMDPKKKRSHRPIEDANLWPVGGANHAAAGSYTEYDLKGFLALVVRGLAQFGSLVAIGYAFGYWVEYESGCAGYLSDKRYRRALDILLSLAAVFFSEKLGFLRSKMDMSWYHRVLKKPSWTPPPIAFPLVWIPLKILQTAAFSMIWEGVNHDVFNPAVLLFLGHLALGDLWNLTFFQERRIGFGLVIMYAFYSVLGFTAYSFRDINPLACYLLLPTLGWVTIASTLNLSIWWKNGKESLFPIK